MTYIWQYYYKNIYYINLIKTTEFDIKSNSRSYRYWKYPPTNIYTLNQPSSIQIVETPKWLNVFDRRPESGGGYREGTCPPLLFWKFLCLRIKGGSDEKWCKFGLLHYSVGGNSNPLLRRNNCCQHGLEMFIFLLFSQYFLRATLNQVARVPPCEVACINLSCFLHVS